MNRRDLLKRQYKEERRPAGIYQLVNRENGKRLIGSSPNLDAIANRHMFQLRMGVHMNRMLQEEWNRYGADAFTFEVLERLDESKVEPAHVTQWLKESLDKWLEQLQPYGEQGYHKRTTS